MQFITSKRIIILVVFVLIIVGIFFGVMFFRKAPPPLIQPVPAPQFSVNKEIIGKSVEGRDIEAFTFEEGTSTSIDKNHILFVGGIHGGYEWNSVLLAYEFVDFLEKNPGAVPKSLKVSIIPSANPDAVYKVIGKTGKFTLNDVPVTIASSDSSIPSDNQITTAALEAARFNSNGVDLNRNFDCKWKPTSSWRSKIVSAGEAAFSEPEAEALKNFVSLKKPNAAVFWHSQADSVYASECETGILPETLDIMNAYANASGYTPVKTFDSYEVTGDAEGWLASIGIPAITVELKSHEAIEWEKNLAGTQAVLNYYDQKVYGR